MSPKPTPAELTLLREIASYDETPKLERLADATGYHERSVRRILRRCEGHGFIELAKKATPWTPAWYRLTPLGQVAIRGDILPGVGGTTCPPAVVNGHRIPVVGSVGSIAVDLHTMASCDQTVAQVGRGTGAGGTPTPSPIPPMGTQDGLLPDQASPMVKSVGAERAKVPEEATNARPQLRTRSDVLSKAASPELEEVRGTSDPGGLLHGLFPARPSGVPRPGRSPLREVRRLAEALSPQDQQAALTGAENYAHYWSDSGLSDDERKYTKSLVWWLRDREWEEWQACKPPRKPERPKRDEYVPVVASDGTEQRMRNARLLADL